jgi:hypothetical protein
VAAVIIHKKESQLERIKFHKISKADNRKIMKNSHLEYIYTALEMFN